VSQGINLRNHAGYPCAWRYGTLIALVWGEMNAKTSIKNPIEKRFPTVLLCGLGALAAFMAAGCCDECNTPVAVDYPPAAPTGVYSITGDTRIDIYWNANTERDLEGYDIFWSYNEDGPFQYLVSVPPQSPRYGDTDVDNGTTYFYEIRAYDHAGHTSEFSYVIFDTPRPAGTNLVLYDYLGQTAGLSGYDFSAYAVQSWNLPTTDVYFGSPNGVPTLFGYGSSVGDGVDVQDYGFGDLDIVDWAPDILDGWSPSKRVEMIRGHSYVIQILDISGYYYYAKVYCRSVSNDFVFLDWAYQIARGNPELSPGQGAKKR
jgi:hypothetical protein